MVDIADGERISVRYVQGKFREEAGAPGSGVANLGLGVGWDCLGIRARSPFSVLNRSKTNLRARPSALPHLQLL
jgi:hypothetical protein